MNKKIARIISSIIIAVLALGVLGELLGVPDYIKAATFTPTEHVSDIISSLQLTSGGERIIRATHPELEDSQTFNENCSSHDAEIYVLGCYDSKSDRLHLYNIDHKDLQGILESTAAHEMLHAAWSRLPIWEKVSLSGELTAVYDSLPEDSDLRDAMQLYTDDELYDELHSRLGTEIADLPAALENHYAKYFADQDQIVAFYTAYNGKYKAIEDKLIELEDQISELGDGMDDEIEHYYTWSTELNTKITQFNNAVKDMTYEEYSAKYAVLAAEIDKLETFFDNLSLKIEKYNTLINEYNEIALEQKDVLDSINSNSGAASSSDNSPPVVLEDPAFNYNN